MPAPDAFASEIAPLASWAARRHAALGRPFVLGISGAQGSGKSTLARLLAQALAGDSELRSAVLSLDDLYLTRAERERLASEVHPLLRTRGAPGTHDVALGERLVAKLRSAGRGERIRVPRFDKAQDERCPSHAWPELEAPIDVLIFEGWCVGARPEPAAALIAPINDLERTQDPDGGWRRHVNTQLEGPYAALFGAVDALVFLAVPDLQSSLAWRREQEHELAAERGAGRAVMSDAEVERFVQHFERVSRHMLAELPQRAEAVLRLDRNHACASLTIRGD